MSAVSVAIMAHPSRSEFVDELQTQLPEAEVVWDRCNDRWDTGRRAVMAYDPDADWHLVVQDDAILCSTFLPGVEAALAGVPLEHPVSFYTGKTRPYGSFMKKTVASARHHRRAWVKMRGPLWGVAIAQPVAMIERMVEGADELDNIPNYDMRIAEWYHWQGIECFYSVPSLVDHRTGPSNPSLVPGRGHSPARTAFEFIGDGDPLRVDWATEPVVPGDPSEYWTEDGTCTRCFKKFDELPEVITHCYERHGLGVVDFLASTHYHARELAELRSLLPKEAQGVLYVVGYGTADRVADLNPIRLNRGSAPRKLGAGPFTIVGAGRDLRLLRRRSGWSLVGGFAN